MTAADIEKIRMDIAQGQAKPADLKISLKDMSPNLIEFKFDLFPMSEAWTDKGALQAYLKESSVESELAEKIMNTLKAETKGDKTEGKSDKAGSVTGTTSTVQ